MMSMRDHLMARTQQKLNELQATKERWMASGDENGGQTSQGWMDLLDQRMEAARQELRELEQA